jgi:hypothetical protein
MIQRIHLLGASGSGTTTGGGGVPIDPHILMRRTFFSLSWQPIPDQAQRSPAIGRQ